MKNFSLAILTNTICLLFIVFLIAFFIFNYFFGYKIAIILSVIISLLFDVFYVMLATSKREKNKQEIDDNKDLEQAFIELNFISKQEIQTRFFKALEKNNKHPSKITKGLFLEDDNTFIYFAFGFEGVTKSDVIKAYNLIKKGEKTIIYASFCSEEVKKFINRFNGFVLLESKEKIYSLLKNTNQLPKPCHLLLDESYHKKASFKNYFDRKRAKSFLTFGLTLSVMSLFVQFKIYYLLAGTIFLIFFLISFFFGKKETTN